MTTSNARLLIVGCAALGLLSLAGCTAMPQPTPTASVTASPAPETPTPTAVPTAPSLVVPDIATGEIARAVFEAEGPDGVPTASVEILDMTVEGVEYTTEVRCVAVDPATVISFSVTTADGADDHVLSGDVRCDGDPWLMSGALEAEILLQVAFTATDGATQAYARILPTEEFLGSP